MMPEGLPAVGGNIPWAEIIGCLKKGKNETSTGVRSSWRLYWMWYGKLTHSRCYDSSTMRDSNCEPEENLSPLNCFFNLGVLWEKMQLGFHPSCPHSLPFCLHSLPPVSVSSPRLSFHSYLHWAVPHEKTSAAPSTTQTRVKIGSSVSGPPVIWFQPLAIGFSSLPLPYPSFPLFSAQPKSRPPPEPSFSGSPDSERGGFSSGFPCVLQVTATCHITHAQDFSSLLGLPKWLPALRGKNSWIFSTS